MQTLKLDFPKPNRGGITGSVQLATANGVKKLPMHSRSLLEAALSRWENEGGARAQRMPSQPPLQAVIRQSLDTELDHLRMRMIAMENLMIALLSQAPDRQLELGNEMAAFISPRPGFTHHPRTLGAAAQMVHVLDRARHFQGRVEGEPLS